MENSMENHEPFITVTSGISGYFAVMLWWNDEDGEDEGFWEPWNTGIGRYATRAEAEKEARYWADLEELEFKP